MEFLVAAVFIGFFIYAAYRVLYLELRGTQTSATIVELRRDDSGDVVIFHPKVRFTTNTGTTIVAESAFGTSDANVLYRVGQQVEVRYSPRNPTFFAIVGYDAAAVLLFFLCAAGIVIMLYWGYLHN